MSILHLFPIKSCDLLSSHEHGQLWGSVHNSKLYKFNLLCDCGIWKFFKLQFK